MKGLVFARVNFSKKSNFGIQLKCEGQVKALRSKFDAVDFLYLKNDGLYLNEKNIYPWDPSTLNSLFSKAKLFAFDLGKIISNKLKLKNYHFFYFRYTLSSPSILHLLEKIKLHNPQIKIIADFPTFPYDQEYHGFVKKVELLIDKKYRPYVAKYIDRATHLGIEKEIWKIPTLAINNGIDPLLFPLSGEQTNWDELRMIAVGNFNYWHGLDRIINGIAASNNKVSCQLRIIGQGYQQVQKLTSDLNLEKQIEFFPPTKGLALDEHFSWANLGIGTLAMHRKGVAINQSLKHREYAARGLSFIYAGNDPELSKGVDGIYHLLENDKPILIDNLIKTIADNRNTLIAFCSRELNWEKSIRNLAEYLVAEST